MNLIMAWIIAILPPVPDRITPELADILDESSPNQKITVIVHMSAGYPLEQMAGLVPVERGRVMKDIALNSQRDIIEYVSNLSSEKAEMGGQYWIFNGFHLKASREVIFELARREDVWFIGENVNVQLPGEGQTGPSPAAAEWNIQRVQADSCWQAGYSGNGVIIGFVDTGMMTTHEALSGKWLSPYWLDAVNGQATPYDDNGHGTAVCGVICGGDGPGPLVNDIGVAYGAKVIPTKAFTSGGSGTYASIDSCLQYLADLRTAGVAIRCVNNSWGTSSTTELHWWTIMLNMKTIGILPAAAVGSSGPGVGTACAPANYPTVIASGSTDASDVIASFSSRGPAPDINPWNDSTFWFYPSWDLLKPDVSAPGVSIRTAYNNGGYANMSGPSFAVAHASGGTALFCDKDSALTVVDLYYLFRAYCDEPAAGAPYPNNNYGWGRINLWRGMQAISAVKENDASTVIRASISVSPTISRGRFNIKYSIGQRIPSKMDEDSRLSDGTKSREIRIYDITGRVIKDLSQCPMPSAQSVVWLGDDDAGRAAPQGVYLIELVCGEDRITAKAVIAR